MPSKGSAVLAYLGWEGVLIVLCLIATVFAGIAWIIIAKGVSDGIAEGIDNMTDRPWWANLPIFGWFWSGEDEAAAKGDD